jgi:hypothetical protein
MAAAGCGVDTTGWTVVEDVALAGATGAAVVALPRLRRRRRLRLWRWSWLELGSCKTLLTFGAQQRG